LTPIVVRAHILFTPAASGEDLFSNAEATEPELMAHY
jgi:hypothetical protein